jgi:transketolase
MRAAIRLSAIMELPVTYVFTHDSIGVGEDDPAHQLIEHVMSLRLIPQLIVLRPADANEVAETWRYALACADYTVTLILSLQPLPTLDRTMYEAASNLSRGAYTLADSDGEPEVILMASGSEVQLCVVAYEQLKSENVKARVVSMPPWGFFERQTAEVSRERVAAERARGVRSKPEHRPVGVNTSAWRVASAPVASSARQLHSKTY